MYTVCLLELLHKGFFVKYQKKRFFFFFAECADDSDMPVPCDNRFKVVFSPHGDASNIAPVLCNVSAETTHCVFCCFFAKFFWPASVLI
jgi:hypothetical protein